MSKAGNSLQAKAEPSDMPSTAALTETKSGQRLIDRITERMKRLQMTQTEVAGALEISPNYFSTLMSGSREFVSCDIAFLQRIAAWLNLPNATIYFDSGLMSPLDFLAAAETDKVLDLVGQTIMNDPTMPGCIPNIEAWRSQSPWIRHLVGLLYQQISGKRLMELKTSSEPVAVIRAASVPPKPGDARVH